MISPLEIWIIPVFVTVVISIIGVALWRFPKLEDHIIDNHQLGLMFVLSLPGYLVITWAGYLIWLATWLILTLL